MSPYALVLTAWLACAASCIAPPRASREPSLPYAPLGTLTDMTPGQTNVQGLVGASFHAQADRSGGPVPPADPQPEEFEQMPTLGGVFQTALWDGTLDAGLEVGGTLSFRSGDGYVFASGSGGGVVAVDIDLSLLDVFGGPFVSLPLGDEVRAYAAAGPLLQFVSWQQSGPGVEQNGSGFGTGLYARSGLELEVHDNLLVGLCVRWYGSHSTLSDSLGHLDLSGTQVLVSFTAGL
ncbi:MAG: hypothetical protein H6828_02480 [Planctomycetes bacterium]|nr:hypothetical protein [Planctomycetota bacterium]